MIERAIEIAMDAHKGQKDKNGQPYIQHVYVWDLEVEQ